MPGGAVALYVAVANRTGCCRASEVVDLRRGFRWQRVGASIAVHPPRFYTVVQFSLEYASSSCPAAISAVTIVLVFLEEKDTELFRTAMRCLSRQVPSDAEVPVVARPPANGWRKPRAFENQVISAYKRWYGFVHMMEYISYQQWCFLNGGWRVFDVTHLKKR